MTDTTVKLRQPINVGGDQVSEVTIRRPKVKDLRALDLARAPGASEMDQAIAMAATLGDLPLEAMDEMDAGDFAAISEIVAGFFPKASA